ncbi:hypothetical protein L3X38_023990 [Prunus dulcis]|uniref:Uncharacterized protein n=1 Tax=Prunus dulcis TaxID=3755 RepID=A0AAD4VZ39_PRUDU|nr:hypothetical protein L3X38_023990 [Prunus dulcis]
MVVERRGGDGGFDWEAGAEGLRDKRGRLTPRTGRKNGYGYLWRSERTPWRAERRPQEMHARCSTKGHRGCFVCCCVRP